MRVSAWALLPAAARPTARMQTRGARPIRPSPPRSTMSSGPASSNAIGRRGCRSPARAVRRRARRRRRRCAGCRRSTGGDVRGLPASADADLRDGDRRGPRVRGSSLVVAPRAGRRTMRSSPLDPDDAGTDAVVDRRRRTLDGRSGPGSSPADPAADAPTTAERLDAVVAALADRLSRGGTSVPAGAGAPRRPTRSSMR